MINNIRKILLIFLITIPFSLSGRERSVLVLNSYHEGYHWTDSIMEGIHSVFDGEDAIDIFIEYMDTKRVSSPEYLEMLYDLYYYKYWNVPIAAVLITDDLALDFMLEYGQKLFPNTPVIFCGINDYNPERFSEYFQISGSYETYDVKGTLKLMIDLHPGTETIAVILDSTVTGEAFKVLVEQAEKSVPGEVKLKYLYNPDVKTLSEELKNLPDKSLVLWAIYLRTGDGEYLSSRESIKLVKDATELPVYCLWDVVGLGVVGGKVTSPFLQGETAAKMVMDVFSGTFVRDISVRESPLDYIFDYREMERYGILKKDLPSGSIILNQPYSILEEYRNLFIAVFAVFIILAVVIFFLVWVIQMRRTAEEALLRSQNQLAQTRKMDAIGQLAGGIAHDFNNILTGIISAAELLKSPGRNLDSTSLKFVDIILKASGQAANLTAKLLAFGRKANVTIETMDMHRVLDDTLLILSQTLNRNIRISLKKTEGNFHVNGDPSSIQNILINLAINASQAMPGGGTIRIETSNRELDSSYCRSSSFKIIPGSYFVLEVIDTGSGISEENLKKIFDPFFTTKRTGSGLGLSAVYGSVQDHQGAIEIESREGAGTTFRIFLPLTDNKVVHENARSEKSTERECILLIDDDQLIRDTLGQQLQNAGYSVFLADSGDNALKVYRENYRDIDVIILDMILEKTNGHDLFFKLQEIDPDCKIIIASGYVDENKLDDLWEKGLYGFLQKPFTMSEMNELIVKGRD